MNNFLKYMPKTKEIIRHAYMISFCWSLGLGTLSLISSSTLAQAQSLPKMNDAIPDAIFKQMISSNKFVGSEGLAWKRRSVSVAFNGGSNELFELIEQTASEWTSQGGEMQFSFRDSSGRFRKWTSQDTVPAAVIRIAFNSDDKNGGYWSAVGAMAQNINANQPTMNLDGFPQKLLPYLNGKNKSAWILSYEHNVTLHEFGHALGLSHEHFHPQCQADLKVEKAIASLMGPPNKWSQTQAKFNMDAAFYFRTLKIQGTLLDSRPTTSSKISQDSVMLYSFTDDFFESGSNSPCKPIGELGYATKLSDSDREYYLANYTNISSPFSPRSPGRQ